MSVSGVSSSSSLSQSLQTWQAKAQKIQSEFQQLGQDLQAGNLTQAQSDFSTLSQNISGPLQSNSALAQAFSCLGIGVAIRKPRRPRRKPTQHFNRMSSKPAKVTTITTTRGVVRRPPTPPRAARCRNCSAAWDQPFNPGICRPHRRPIRRSRKTYSNLAWARVPRRS